MDIELINGNWLETIAHMLNDYIASTSGSTTGTTINEILLEQNITLPPEHLVVYTNYPITHQQQPIQVKKKIVQSPPVIHNIPNKNIKTMWCSGFGDWRASMCGECIDKHIAENVGAWPTDMRYCKMNFLNEKERKSYQC